MSEIPNRVVPSPAEAKLAHTAGENPLENLFPHIFPPIEPGQFAGNLIESLITNVSAKVPHGKS